jgi:hypothetical protein
MVRMQSGSSARMATMTTHEEATGSACVLAAWLVRIV